MSLPISGFTAVPNPQMLAFMAAQSFVMMMQAGEGWQYGKRKQSAMTNEEFNKQTPLSIMQRQMSELKSAIPTIEENMNNMTPMIRAIVIQYGDFMKEIISSLPKVIAAATGNQTLTGNISTVGQEFADILKNLIPNLPPADATLYTNNPDLPPPPPDSSGDSNFGGSEITTSFNQIEYQKRLDASVAAAEELKRKSIPSAQTLKASTDAEYLAWITKLGQLKQQYQTKTAYIAAMDAKIAQGGATGIKAKAWKATAVNARFTISTKIRAMSRDYRHPNNLIRENALRLRGNMSQWSQ